MSALLNALYSRSRSLVLIFVFIFISGWIGYKTIPKEAQPDVIIPIIYVSIVYEGISPEDAERMLLRPMEYELRNIEGIKESYSSARTGQGSVVMKFIAGTDRKKALADVREKISLVRSKLPEGAEEPTIHEVTLGEESPVATIALYGKVSKRTLYQRAKELQQKIESIKQVMMVKVSGSREDMLEIIINPMLLETYNISLSELRNVILSNNQIVAAGAITNNNGSFNVKIPSVIENVNDVLSLPLRAEGEKIITFDDIAEVRRSFKEPESYSRFNGEESVSLEVVKRPGENTVQAVQRVLESINEEKKNWSPALKVELIDNKADEVRIMLNELENSILFAVILVSIIVLANMGIKSSLLVGITIPGAFLIGVICLWSIGVTINNVVLFGLIMSVGLLVDGAIVVAEYADRKILQGESVEKAYSSAGIRMCSPIFTSTVTTLVVFIPLLFWPGVTGEFMKYLPITLVATLVGSLMMALVFVPILGKVLGKKNNASVKKEKAVDKQKLDEVPTQMLLLNHYIKMLNWSLKYPWYTLMTAILLGGGIALGYSQLGKGIEFFPTIEPSRIDVIIRARGELSLAEKDRLVKNVEAKISDMKSISSFYTRVGGKDVIGKIRLGLVDWQYRRNAETIIQELNHRTKDMPGILVDFEQERSGPGHGKTFQLKIFSNFPTILEGEARRILNQLEQNNALINLQSTLPHDGLEWSVEIDRIEAAKSGVNILDIGGVYQLVTNGYKVAEYRPNDVDKEVDIRVRFPAEYREIRQLDNLRIVGESGIVPVSNFIRKVASKKTTDIQRYGGKRVISIMADLKPGVSLTNQMPQIEKVIKQLKLDPRVVIKYAGETERSRQSTDFLSLSFSIAIFAVAIILVSQFNSFYQALLVLTAVIFSIFGVFLGLILLQQPFGIVMSGIGVIALAGIVVNNNIVLIDTYNQLRQEGLDADKAIFITGVQRFRPVILTSLTTTLGLLPMVFGINVDIFAQQIIVGGPSTQWWTQLATAVAGGLTFSTLLTLVLTPSLLILYDRFKSKKLSFKWNVTTLVKGKN